MARLPLPEHDARRLGAVFDAIRAEAPRVHCITSVVAAERTANTLLAIGAQPSLTANPDEIADFVSASRSLLINLGMFNPANTQTVYGAALAAGEHGKPWVLDPVFVNLSARRHEVALDMLKLEPNVLRTNGEEAILHAAATPSTVRICTGETDVIEHGGRRVAVSNGHPLGGCMTAIGCALGAVIAASLAVEKDAVIASAAALAGYGIAIEQAAAMAKGPGSFSIALYDQLAALDGATIERDARVA